MVARLLDGAGGGATARAQSGGLEIFYTLYEDCSGRMLSSATIVKTLRALSSVCFLSFVLV